MLRVPTLESETMRNETSGFLSFKTKIICGTVVAEEEKKSLDTTISSLSKSYIRHKDFLLRPPPSVTLVLPLKPKTGWTGELWSNCVLLILKN